MPAILVYGTPSDPALTQASWFRAEDKEAVKAAAKELKFSVMELLPLAFLAPEIVEAIVRGTQPKDLTAKKLIRRTHLPLE